MDPQKQREIASKGGKAAHQKGTAHEFTSEEARIAGRKGGAASRAKRSAQVEHTTQPPPGAMREDQERGGEQPASAEMSDSSERPV